MSKKDELQAQRNELFNHSSDTLARIAELEKQIAEAEVTYSIGDRFTDEEGEKCILGSASENEVIIIGLKKGYRYCEPVSVSGYYKIPQIEFFEKFSDCGFTRYWDARKQCKC